jgi:hypothetical protein
VIDIWEPQLAIGEVAAAEEASNDWLEWAKWSLIELSTGSRAEHDSIGVKLLKAIRAIRDARAPSTAIFSSDLASDLHSMGEEWTEYGRAHKPITTVQIARILARYEIRPERVWSDEKRDRGYEWAWFEKAFKTYLPPDSGTAAESSTGQVENPTCPPGNPLISQEIGENVDRWTGCGDPLLELKKKGIKWSRLSEFRAIRRAQRKGSPQPRITFLDSDPSTPTPVLGNKPSPGRAIVNGHETAMLDTGDLERAVLPVGGIGQAALDRSGIEFRNKGK